MGKSTAAVLVLLFLVSSLVYPQTGWSPQQTGSSGKVLDIKFINPNTGWILFGVPRGLSKTTNGGANWVYSSLSVDLTKITPFNDTLIYGNIGSIFHKTTNGGANWTQYNLPAGGLLQGFTFISPDTGFVKIDDMDNVYIYRTNTGLAGFFQIYFLPVSQQGELFFINKKINGNLYGWDNRMGSLYFTSNGGTSWTMKGTMPSGYPGMFFLNKDTGWTCSPPGSPSVIYRTVNGGANWTGVNLPNNYKPKNVFFTDNNRGWAGTDSGRIYISTNGGQNWGYQLMPSSVPGASVICFTDSLHGWAGRINPIGATVNGGGVITFTGNNPAEIPGDFYMSQNYPNPFNPLTRIDYAVPERGRVILRIHDMLGREIKTLVKEEKEAGKYSVDFSAEDLPSGVYFYKIISGEYSEVKRMVLIK